jgi:hypothetical protein
MLPDSDMAQPVLSGAGIPDMLNGCQREAAVAVGSTDYRRTLQRSVVARRRHRRSGSGGTSRIRSCCVMERLLDASIC